MAAEAEVSDQFQGTHIYDGLRLFPRMTPAALDAVKDVRFFPEDVLILTYPKSGTTWVAEIAWLVKTEANIEESYNELRTNRSYFLEFHRPDQKQPDSLRIPKIPGRHMTSHLPARFLGKQLIVGNSKVIIVIRDLKDTLVSIFNHLRNNQPILYEGTWDMFFELFKKKQLIYGDWGEFYKEWQKYKDNPNFLFLQYESMNLDPHQAVRMVAKQCNKPLTEDQVNTIVHHTGFEQMKTNPMLRNNAVKNFFRKGVVGDWRNYFSTDQLSFVEQYEKELNLDTVITGFSPI